MVHPEDNLSYQPLVGAAEIRLLEVLPGPDEQTIQCIIKHVSLDDSPKYVALSYTWGSRENPSDILCDGKRFSVTANLYSALYKCRDTNTRITLWIDAICINQLDIPEREKQVRMMKDIYEKAEAVMVDLGEAGKGAELIQPLLSKIIVLLKQHGMNWAIPQTQFEEFGLPSAEAQDWKELSLLLCRPWFRRVWIIQEFALAQSPNIAYGRIILSWQDLYWTVYWLKSHGMFAHMAPLSDRLPNGHPISLSASVNYFNIVNIREGRLLHKPKSFIKCLRQTRSFEATDPRDKVYGLLGLIPDIDKFDFKVIYSDEETLEKVYVRLAQALVKSGEAYNVLLSAGTKVSSISVPSWVPDWSREQEVNQFSLSLDDSKSSIYHAGGLEKISATILEETPKLAVRGQLFDDILLLGQTYHSSPPKEGEGMENVMRWDAQSRILIGDLSSYPTGEPVHDVYRRVLVANKDDLDNEASAAYIAHYKRMLRSFQIHEQVKSHIKGGPPFDFNEEELKSISQSLKKYAVPMGGRISSRRLCVTRKGYMGLVPNSAREGDSICVFIGAEVPFVLGRSGDEYRLVGDCYVHGIMKGEALDMADSTVQDIVLL